ncbi:MAG: 50S ribosomal protein L29 [bacterium]|nr:50S ribosomal protein L29 [bacterium]
MNALKEKSEPELSSAIGAAREKLQAFRFAAAGSKAKNVKEGRNLRKEIARMLTELRKRNTESRSSNIEK